MAPSVSESVGTYEARALAERSPPLTPARRKVTPLPTLCVQYILLRTDLPRGTLTVCHYDTT